MQTTFLSLSTFTGHYLRFFFLRLLTGLVVGRPPEEIHRRIHALPLSDQVMLVATTLIGLLLATLLFACAGPGGPLAMWVTLWMLVR